MQAILSWCNSRIQTKEQSFLLQAIDIFMSSCTVFVFLSLIEYAFVNVMMGDISEVERKDKTSHLRNIIVTANTSLGYNMPGYSPNMQQQQQNQQKYSGTPGCGTGAPEPGVQHSSQSNFHIIKVRTIYYI